MQLLVSVANADDARAARDGGADLIDAKDPLSGALGALSAQELRAIHAAVAGVRPVTAALGDAVDAAALEDAARIAAAAGTAFVKVGFAGVASRDHIATLTSAAVRGARLGGRADVVAVAYADAGPSDLHPDDVISAATDAGARGVLLDTANKQGPGLRELLDRAALTAWIARAHAAGLFAAVAGRLVLDDLAFVRSCGADIAGVRGAACVGGRAGQVQSERVRELRLALHPRV
jgi:uncharacterized protein (UPF0264 family)